MEEKEKINNKKGSISYSQIGILTFTFSLGIVMALLFANAQVGTSTTFTSTELIGFSLTVILSGASIVLAVTAITLGKYSEHSITKRSDESIRLQNEVFMKTTDALQRIESSTGVTEKRIEDIISGRVGDISHKIAEIASSKSSRKHETPQELEENIKKSIFDALESEFGNFYPKINSKINLKPYEEKETRTRMEKYDKAHGEILYTIANKKGVSVEKLGHGSSFEEGDDLFDGIFKKDNKRFAVSTYRDNTNFEIYSTYLNSSAEELSKKTVDSIFLFIFYNENEDKEYLKETEDNIDTILNNFKDNISNNITFKIIPYSSAKTEATKLKF